MVKETTPALRCCFCLWQWTQMDHFLLMRTNDVTLPSAVATWQRGYKGPPHYCGGQHISWLKTERAYFYRLTQVFKKCVHITEEWHFFTSNFDLSPNQSIGSFRPFSSEEKRLRKRLFICCQDGCQATGQQTAALCTLSVQQSLLVCQRNSSGKKVNKDTISLPERQRHHFARKGLCLTQRRNILKY